MIVRGAWTAIAILTDLSCGTLIGISTSTFAVSADQIPRALAVVCATTFAIDARLIGRTIAVVLAGIAEITHIRTFIVVIGVAVITRFAIVQDAVATARIHTIGSAGIRRNIAVIDAVITLLARSGGHTITANR